MKNAIVFGENASGKTNLGWALMDIVIHLTDSMKNIANYNNYVNLNSNDKLAHFEYTFCFDGDILVYYYEKEEVGKVLREKVSINHREVLSADMGYEAKVCLKGAERLKLDMWDSSIPLVKYVARNTVLDKDDTNSRTFMRFVRFVERMFWFSSANGKNLYCLYKNKVVLFQNIWSSGTRALAFLFLWYFRHTTRI